MKKSMNYFVVIVLTGALFSCVPQRKLEEEQAKRESCEKELADLKTKSQDLRMHKTTGFVNKVTVLYTVYFTANHHGW